MESKLINWCVDVLFLAVVHLFLALVLYGTG